MNLLFRVARQWNFRHTAKDKRSSTTSWFGRFVDSASLLFSFYALLEVMVSIGRNDRNGCHFSLFLRCKEPTLQPAEFKIQWSQGPNSEGHGSWHVGTTYPTTYQQPATLLCTLLLEARGQRYIPTASRDARVDARHKYRIRYNIRVPSYPFTRLSQWKQAAQNLRTL